MTFVHLLPSYEQIQTTENLAREAAENLSASDHEIKFIEKITLSDISFSYGDKQVLRGVNITLNAGTTTALIGPSGAGKTTVADLISGLLKPSQGVIAIDGAALDEANTRSWRNRLSYVAQDTFIFDDTVMNNLLWARPDAGDSEIERSLISANALEFVSELENGLNTYVGERGVKLSSGQRQRIALARALLRRPSLLILDEATSALDTENEAHILSALEGLRGSATVLIISHRISAVKNADFIYVIDGGEVVESGSLEELKADKNSRFNKVMSSKGVFD